MEQLDAFFGNFDSTLGEALGNPYIAASVSIFLILYSGLAAPSLPAPVAKLFDFTLFKMLVLVLILLVNNYNQPLAILFAVAFFLSLQTVSTYKMGGIAKYYGEMKAKMGQVTGMGADGEEVQEPGPKISQYQVGIDDALGESQVSGLASRTPYYSGPQGMKHPVGYAGPIEGADFD